MRGIFIYMDIHENFMKLALDEAKKAEDIDEVPVGAVIVRNGEIISKAFNKRETSKDATSHAEITAIKKACEALGGWRLIGCEMYVTLEPCLMCSGALYWSKIGKIFFGAFDEKNGYRKNTGDHNPFHPKTVVSGGLLQEECAELMKAFFREKRV